ncbi:response regulator [Melissospora conviva]|uniref:response regulator n=1 Tax=Melissospora conviva TaxID=3388432 RepID=UPI003C1CF81E
MSDQARVLIVDDHPVVRRGLRTMLEGESWVAEVQEAASCAEAIAAVTHGQVTVVAMDLALPDGDGIQATSQILRHRPEIAVIMLTMADEDELVARALRIGARGYLLKDTDPDLVVDALRTVAGGGLVLGPGITVAALGQAQPAVDNLPPPFDRLTPRERDILAHLAAGDDNAQIARRFGLSTKTIRNQVSAILGKLGVGDRVQAALLARDAGIGAEKRST